MDVVQPESEGLYPGLTSGDRSPIPTPSQYPESGTCYGLPNY